MVPNPDIELTPSNPREPRLATPSEIAEETERVDIPTVTVPPYPDPPEERPRVNILDRLKNRQTVYGVLVGLAAAIAAVTGFEIPDPILNVAAFVVSGIISVVLIFWKPKSE